ncbi:MAG: transcriptional repressor [Oceanospirillales bacterium]|jgi:Fur family zinc uptake transcriptional regulator|nr:transcriptional repressor [Oceanospirillales bacterium]
MAIDSSRLIHEVSSVGKTLTPQRLAIYRALETAKDPLTAYELKDQVNHLSKESFNISTIYRVLDFWTELGLIHKIDSSNTFIVCNDEHRNHVHVLQHCTQCQSVKESCEISSLMKMPESASFLIDTHQVIEIQGQCAKCSDTTGNRATATHHQK